MKGFWLKRHLTPHFLPALAEAVHFEHGGIDGVGKTIDSNHDAMVTASAPLKEMLFAIR